MRFVLIASLAAVSASAGVSTQSSGMLPGETVGILLSSPDGVFAGSGQLQTSPDNATWTNVGTAQSSVGAKVNIVLLDRFIRLNVTARTGGTLEAVLIGNPG